MFTFEPDPDLIAEMKAAQPNVLHVNFGARPRAIEPELTALHDPVSAPCDVEPSGDDAA